MKEYIVRLTKPPELKIILAIDEEDAYDLIIERYSCERISQIEEVKPPDKDKPSDEPL